jgi:Holliday junction resolvase
MPINSRQKGKAGELELAHYLTDAGFPARRGQQFRGGGDSPDVVCESLSGLGFDIECKRVQSLNIHRAVSQCDDEGLNDPVVMHRKNGEQWLATMPLDVFLFHMLRMQEFTK